MRGRDHEYGDRPCRERRPERNDLAWKFERCGRLLSHCLGKRRGQGRILRTPCQRGEMSQKEIQDLLDIQAGSMSEIAAKLEDKGLIVRVRSQEDRRKMSLSITEQGQALVDQWDAAQMVHRRAELFSTLTPEEQNTLESLLDSCQRTGPSDRDVVKNEKRSRLTYLHVSRLRFSPPNINQRSTNLLYRFHAPLW